MSHLSTTLATPVRTGDAEVDYLLHVTARSSDFLVATVRTRSGSVYHVVRRNGMTTIVHPDGQAYTGELTISDTGALHLWVDFSLILRTTPAVSVHIHEN